MKVLLAYDGTPPAKCALKFISGFFNAIDKLVVLYVIPPVIGSSVAFDSFVPSSVYQNQTEVANGILEMAKKQAEEYKISADYMTADSAGDLVSRIIYKVAKDNTIDVVVTGTRRLKGLSKVILGSVSSELISISDIPVLTVPRTDD